MKFFSETQAYLEFLKETEIPADKREEYENCGVIIDLFEGWMAINNHIFIVPFDEYP